MATNVNAKTAAPAPPADANGVPPELDPMPIIAVDMPVMFEDEGQDEMGESEPHTLADHILRTGLVAHFASRAELRVLSNLNVYYHQLSRWAYVSPDLMVVRPSRTLPDRVSSYRIGVHGPAPDLNIEILSRRSFQQQDLTNKPIIYSQLGVAEYILVDGTSEFLERRLLLKRLQDDGSWVDEQDADGGVTSRLGFRVVLKDDSHPRVIETVTGRRYLRPEEAQVAYEAELEARRRAEEELRVLRDEMERRRGTPPA